MPQLPSLEPSAVNHRIHRIVLEPNTSGWLVDLKVFVNEVEVHKLPTVKKGQSLHWEDVLNYDVWKGSRISVQLHKTPNGTFIKKVRGLLHWDKPHVIPVQYEVWDTKSQQHEEIMPEVLSKKYTVTIVWTTRPLGEGETGEFLESVLRDVAEVERQVVGNKRLQTPNAIKEFVRFGGTKNEGKTGFHRIVGLINKGKAWKQMLQSLVIGAPIPKFLEANARAINAIGLLASVEADALHDKVFRIYNRKHHTGVKVAENAHRATIAGAIHSEEDTGGRMWRVRRSDDPDSRWYSFSPEGYNGMFASPDGSNEVEITLADTETWWTLQEVENTENVYMIQDRNRPKCWGLSDNGVGTPLKLQQHAPSDHATHWQFVLVLP